MRIYVKLMLFVLMSVVLYCLPFFRREIYINFQL